MNKLAFLLAMVLILSCGAISANHADAPILTVEVNNQSSSDIFTFKREDLDIFPSTVIRTSTKWTFGAAAYSGVELELLLRKNGWDGRDIKLRTLNDYEIEIPWKFIEGNHAVLAIRRNGINMNTRDKGPVWLLYPFDSEEKYRNQLTYSRSIWQIYHITILPKPNTPEAN